ncbi:MAG: hypothetical protein M3O32_04625 [Actinomycetota bacterium]|nr:hypothetical protein [Actinomycetota bacterium]
MTAADVGSKTNATDSSSAMLSVVAAERTLTAAKRTRSAPAIEDAQRDLQAAVDAARSLAVGWGEIGAALGIARGNAYQRFRTKPSVGSLTPA